MNTPIRDRIRDPESPIPIRGSNVSLLVGLGLMLAVGVGFWYWFVERVEVNPNEILVLVNKTGKSVPPELRHEYGDQVVLYPALVSAIKSAAGESEDEIRHGYKGIQFEIRSEGRYFLNPLFYKRLVIPTTNIKQGEMGVLVRKYGQPLPFPKTVATDENERGPVAEILRPGRHNINLLAYDVQKFPAIQIPEGHVGVVTLLSGTDPAVPNSYTVETGAKGVQKETLKPGLEYYNPYLKRIDIVDLRNQKRDLIGEDAIHFPSNDSFTITIEGTIEWAIDPDRVARVMITFGDQEDILQKVVLPNVRSIARIEGSKLLAREFISGKTRTAFQDRLLSQLRNECWQEGIIIHSALVRDILPPAEIANLISLREKADQEIQRYTNQMEEAKSEAKLVEQQEMQEQNKAQGDARREVVTVTKDAEKEKNIAVTQSRRNFEVAKLNLEAAEKEAAAIRSKGQAEANVVLFNFIARAEPLKAAVDAFGDGQTYAQMFFLEKTAPAIQSILSNTEGPFAEIFKQFQEFKHAPTSKGGSQ